MNRLATMTVIRGNGGCEAYMDGILKDEMAKMGERHTKELQKIESELGVVKKHRNELLSNKLLLLKALNAKKMSIHCRAKERLVTLWCVIYAIGEQLKFWEYSHE